MSDSSTISTPGPASPEEQTSGRAALSNTAAVVGKPVIFFDGVCGLCNHFVDFVLPRDKQRVFMFSPLQGETAARLLDPRDTTVISSVVLRDEAGNSTRKSSAVVRVFWRLGGFWWLLGWLIWLIPRPLRDLGYRAVAWVRYPLFGKKESCRMPTPDERSRFLP